MESVVLGGVTLTSSYVVEGVVRPLPTPVPSYEAVAGSDRNVILDVRFEPPTISFTIIATDKTASQRRTMARDLAAILLSKQPVTLSFSGDGGKYYRGVVSDELEMREFVRCGLLPVSFLCDSAAMYGTTRTVTVPSGGTASVTVGGTYPTRPSVVCESAVRNSSSLVWGLKLDDQKFVHVMTGSSSSRRVEFDCEARVCKVSNSLTLPTLDSDWLELTPGSHTLKNDQGSGSCVVTFTERHL